MRWENKYFIDFIQLQRGHDLTKSQIKPGIYPVVTSTSIMGFHNAFKAEGPGVVTGRSGTIGEVQYIEENYWPHNTCLYVKDFKGNYPRFVYCFLKNFGTGRAKSGSAVPTLNRNNLSKIPVKIPNLETQKRIASILSAYDDLIETHRKQIKLLEEAAQRLYKEWFVDFRFPGHENVKIVDGVPEGWEKVPVGDVVTFLNGFAFKSKEFVENGKYSIATIKNVQDGYFNPDPANGINEIPKNMPDHCSLIKGDILLSLTGNVGRACIIHCDDFLLNQRVAKLESDYKSFVYCLFRNSNFSNEIINLANGTAQKNLSPIRAAQILITKPPEELLLHFEEIVCIYFEQMVRLYSQISLLREARDRLLPKLMSGKIEAKSYSSVDEMLKDN